MSSEAPGASAEIQPNDELLDIAFNELYARHFRGVMTDVAYSDFEDNMRALRQLNQGSNVGEFVLLLYPVETHEELTMPNTTKWIGVHYDFAVEKTMKFQAKEKLISQSGIDIHLVEGFEDIFTHTMRMPDVNWEWIELARRQRISDTNT